MIEVCNTLEISARNMGLSISELKIKYSEVTKRSTKQKFLGSE